MKYKLTRTVSYYGENDENPEEEFKKLYPTGIIEIVDDVSVSGVVSEEIEAETHEELISLCENMEYLSNECFSVYNNEGKTVLTEEFENDYSEYDN